MSDMKHSFVRAALLLALATGACAPDEIIDPGDRPDPPPAAAFDADFTFFETRSPAPGGPTSSWGQALQTVAMARADMARLDLPEAMIRDATRANGTRSGSVWTWPFDTIVAGGRYHGDLRATISGSQYAWDLVVSAPDHSPQLSGFIWGNAVTPPGGFEGRWWLADAAAGRDSVVAGVSWIVNPDNGINFAFSASDSAGWVYERALSGNVLTYVLFSLPHRRVTWLPDGTGSSWTATTVLACWDTDLHDIVC
jgi:hypothetical protein